MNQLNSKMKKVTIRGRSRSRSRSRSRGRARTPGPSQPRKAKGGKQSAAVPRFHPEGTASMARNEVVLTISGDADGKISGSLNIDPVVDALKNTFLRTMAAMFASIAWHKLRIHWAPVLGSADSGFFAFGVDYTGTALTNDFKHIVALTPNSAGNLLSPASINVDIQRIQPQRWMRMQIDNHEAIPAAISYYGEGPKSKVWGFIKWEYAVEFIGTKLAT